MVLNPYFHPQSESEQNLVEDLIIESIQIYGKQFYYIPRTLVNENLIFVEDRSSIYSNAYPIEMYFESIDAYEGEDTFVNQFIEIKKTARIAVARKSWNNAVADLVPNRPREGDLLWFPMTNTMLQINHVVHDNPFYQLEKLYVYRLTVEVWQYSSEELDTGIDEIDQIEDEETMDGNSTLDEVEQDDPYAKNKTLSELASGLLTDDD